MALNLTKNRLLKDLVFNLAGSFIPILVGIIRSPVFTRYFTPEEYGYYGIIFITYSLLSIFLFTWLTNCVWRFYNQYKKKGNLNGFYTNLFFLYTVFSVVFLIISLIWHQMSAEMITRKLTLLIFLQLLISTPVNYILIVYRLEIKTGRYNIIQSLRAVLSFGIQYWMTFRLDFRIEAIPISSIIIELLVLAFIIPHFMKDLKLKLNMISLPIIKNLFGYSLPGLVSNLGLLILASSDRYVIQLFGTMDEVGIYNQVYNLSQVSIMALINVYFAMINPDFLKALEYHFKGTGTLTRYYLFAFILIILPISVYLSLFARQIATLLLGPEFRVGYTLIPWIMMSTFVYGLTLFSENRLKFNSQYKHVIIGFFIIAALNIALNFIFIPSLGYEFAAISTFISYVVLFIYFIFLDCRYTSFSPGGWTIMLPAIGILGIETVFDLYVRHTYPELLGITGTIIEIVVFSALYCLVLIKYCCQPVQVVIRSFKYSEN